MSRTRHCSNPRSPFLPLAALAVSAVTPVLAANNPMVEMVSGCMDRVRAAEDAVKGKGADAQAVYDFFVKNYGPPKSFEQDNQNLIFYYDMSLKAANGKKVTTRVKYEMHFETSESTALFGMVHSVSEPYLLGSCGGSLNPDALQ